MEQKFFRDKAGDASGTNALHPRHFCSHYLQPVDKKMANTQTWG